MAKSVPIEERCVAEVWRHEGLWSSHSRCQRRGTVEREGKLYCRQHDPEAVKQRNAERVERYHSRYEADQQRLAEAKVRCGRLGCGKPHFSSRTLEYDGGLVLTAEEADLLIERLGRVREAEP